MATMQGFTLSMAILLAAGHSDLASPASSDSLTVESAVHIALEHQPAVRAAAEAVRASAARIEQSRSAYYPDLTGVGAYSRVGPVPSIQVPGFGNFELFPRNNYDIHFAVQQLVFDFGRTQAQVGLAQSGLHAANDNLDLTKVSLAYRTIQTFYSLLYLHQNIDVIQEQIELLNRHVQANEKRVQAGTATEFDVLTTRVRVAEAQNQMTDVEKMLRSQEIAFRQLLGMPADSPVQLQGDFSVLPGSGPLEPDSLTALALQRRPEIRLLRHSEEAADIQVRLASLGHLPELRLSVLGGAKNGYVPDLDVMKADWQAGVQLAVPIFNGFRTRSQEQEARAEYRAARERTEDMKLEIDSQVRQAIESMRASLQMLQTTEIQVRHAEQALAMAEVRYRSGVITNLDLLEAETALAQAKLRRVQTQYNYVTSWYALQRATGATPW